MRIIDADILSYALFDEHIANEYAWSIVEKSITRKITLYVTHTTILETYNVLYWLYKIRPRNKLLKKLKLVINNLKIVQPSVRGIDIALDQNIPLGDGILIATALDNNIPIIVSNDDHIIKKAPDYGLIVENPIPDEIRRELGQE